MVRFVATKRSANGNSTLLVAGDLNVGETDKKKIGFNLTDEFVGANNTYDETHAIFSAGLVDGIHMTSLTQGIGAETYDDPQFAGSGPIDCIYVIGAQAGDFTIAKKTSETFGSDHFAVSTRFLFSGTVPTPTPGAGGGGGGVSVSSTVKIVSLLPNPDGPDPGNEKITLRNDGTIAVDLDGWTITDEASNSLTLSGTINAGAELIINLAQGQVPLNNGGDEIELRNDSGELVQVVNYQGSDVVSGAEVAVP